MKYTAYLRWGTLAALFAALFVPFVVADGGQNWVAHPLTYIPFFNSFFPFITGKNFFFRILVELALLGYILLALKRPEYRPRASYLMWAVLGLVVWMGIATAFAVDPVKSFWSNFERMEGYLGLLHLFAFFVVAGSVLTVDKLWDRFLATSVGASVFMCLLALMQIMGALPISTQSGSRADTTFGNAAYLAVYLLVHFFITLYMLSRERVSKGMQAFYGVALVLQATGIYYTQTRGALLGLVGGLFVAALYMAVWGRGSENRQLRRVALGAIAAMVLLGGIFYAVRDTAFIQNSETLSRIAQISLNDTTTRSRLLYIWPMAIEGGLQKPITGWGQENFSYIFNANYDPQMYNQEQWFDRAHNQFLDWFVAGGIPALLLYVSLYVLAALAIMRSHLPVASRAALLGLLGAYGVNNMLVFDNLGSSIFFFALLAFAYGLSRKELPGAVRFSRPLSDHALAIAAPAVALVVLGAGWFFNVPGIVRAQLLTGSINAEPAVAIPQFERAVGGGVWPGNPHGVQEATEQLLQYTPRVVGSDADPALQEDIADLAVQAGEALVAQRQNDARLELFMTSLYSTVGDRDKALHYAELALEHSPDKQQILFQLGTLYLQDGAVQKGLDTLKHAYELAPAYDTARIIYASAYYTLGLMPMGDQLIRERYDAVIVDNDQLLNVYMGTSQYDRAAAIWQLRIDKEPENVDHRLRQAEVYLSAGNNAKVIAVLREVAKIRPTLAGQVEELIKNVQAGKYKQ